MSTDSTTTEENAKPKRKLNGRLITSENARQYATTAAQAKKIRCKVRAEMVAKVAKSMDLGDELVKAIKSKDVKYVEVIERALKLVGLDYAASEDARKQNLKIDQKTDAKVNITVKGLDG